MASQEYQKAYANAVGLTEAFASFFERLTSASPNHPQYAKSLYNFKSMIYKNLTNSQSGPGSQVEGIDTVPTMTSTSDEALHTQYTDRKSSKDLTNSPNSLTSLAEPIQPPKAKKLRRHISSDNLLDQAYDSYIEILENKEAKRLQNDESNRSIEKLGTPGVGNTSIENEEELASHTEFNINIKNLSTIFDFLSLLKANEHPDLNTLFLMAADYSHVRSFIGSQQSVFLTLSFVFFERILVQDTNTDYIHPLITEVLEREAAKSKDEADSEYESFVSLVKEAFETRNHEKCVLLFDSMCLSPEIYEASLTFFKEIVLQILTKCGSPRLAEDQKDSFKWMNEVSQADEQFFQMFAQILQVTLISQLLSQEKVVKKTINSNLKKRPVAPSASPKKTKSNSEVTIFYDKRRNASYIIYKNRDIRRSPNLESQLQRNQIHMAPSVNLTKPPRAVLRDQQRKALTQIQNNQEPEVSKFNISPLKLALNKPMKTEEPRSLRAREEEEPAIKLIKLFDDVQPKKRDITPTVHRQETQPDTYLAKVTSPTFGPVDELSYLPRDYSPLGAAAIDTRNKKYKQLSLDFNPTVEKALPIPQNIVKPEEKIIEEPHFAPKASNDNLSYKEISSILSMHKEVDAILKSPGLNDQGLSGSGISPLLSLHKEVDALLKSPLLLGSEQLGTLEKSVSSINKEVDRILKSPILPAPTTHSLHETSPILALHKQIDSILKSPLLNRPIGSMMTENSSVSSLHRDVPPVLSKSTEQTENIVHPTMNVSPILEMIKEADMILKSPNVRFQSDKVYDTSLYSFYHKEIAPVTTKDFSPNSFYKPEKAHSMPPISSFSDVVLGDLTKYEPKTYGVTTLLGKDDPVQKAVDDALKFAKGHSSYVPTLKTPIKTIPNLLKERFASCNLEVQLHEPEINGIMARYTPKQPAEKIVSGKMALLKDKYNKIVQNKAMKKIYP